MRGRQFVLLLAGLLAASCAAGRRTVKPEPAALLPSAEAAAQALASSKAGEPESFKMVHQVVARFQGKNFLMTGYLLGRKGGDFRVSAVAAMGPRLFDVVKLHGQWDAQVHLPQLANRLDPRNIGRAVERIYFLDATGPLVADRGTWRSSSALPGEEDVDRIDTWRDGRTLALVKKEFFQGGRRVLEVDYDAPERSGGQLLSRHVKLKDARGFELELQVTAYVPGFPVPEEKLQLHPSAGT